MVITDCLVCGHKLEQDEIKCPVLLKSIYNISTWVIICRGCISKYRLVELPNIWVVSKSGVVVDPYLMVKLGVDYINSNRDLLLAIARRSASVRIRRFRSAKGSWYVVNSAFNEEAIKEFKRIPTRTWCTLSQANFFKSDQRKAINEVIERNFYGKIVLCDYGWYVVGDPLTQSLVYKTRIASKHIDPMVLNPASCAKFEIKDEGEGLKWGTGAKWFDDSGRLRFGYFRGRTLYDLGNRGESYANWLLKSIKNLDQNDRIRIREFLNWCQSLIDDCEQDQDFGGWCGTF